MMFTIFECLSTYFNPFVPNASYLYPLKTSENIKVFWCFQGVQKGCIESKWIKREKNYELIMIGFWLIIMVGWRIEKDLDLGPASLNHANFSKKYYPYPYLLVGWNFNDIFKNLL